MIRPALLAVVLAFPAQARMLDDGFKPCGDAANTVATVTCLQGKIADADRRLNQAYRALGKAVDPAQAEPLKRAQRAWLQFRDANCAFYDAAAGTIRQITAAECLRALTADRAVELEQAAQP